MYDIILQKSWYHIQRMKIGDTVSAICVCPGTFRQTATCYHVRFLEGELSEQYIQSQDTFYSIGGSYLYKL